MEDLAELLRIRLELAEFKGYLTGDEKKAQSAVERRYNALRNRIVYRLLADQPERGAAEARMREAMAAERPGTPDHLMWVTDDVEADLAAQIEKQGGRKPWLRTLIHRGPLILVALAAIGFVGLRFYLLLPLDAKPDTRDWLQQRAAATQKAIRYGEFTDVRRNRLVAELLGWPTQPTDEEARATSEFVGLVLEARAVLAKDRLICGVPEPSQDLTQVDIALAGSVAKAIRAPDVRWANPPMMTIIPLVARAYPCADARPAT